MILTPLKIRKSKPQDTPYKLRDGRGLVLEVRPSGMKVWRWRFRLGGKEQMLTIGEYGDRPGQFNCAAAREERDRARKLVKAGKHPGHERKAEVTTTLAETKNTFRAMAMAWIENHGAHWSPSYRQQVSDALHDVAFPALGDRPIKSITSADVLDVLMTRKKTARSALLLQMWIGAVFRYAIIHRRADSDPTYPLRGAIKRPPVKHHKPLQIPEIPAFLTALEGVSAERATRLGLRLLLATFVRPSELVGAKLAEFDLDDALWKIPADRMKMRDAHYVPLSRQAVAIVRELRDLAGASQWLLPSREGKPLRADALNGLIHRMGYSDKVSPHGFRATASTAFNEMGYRPDIIEKQLAHAERNQSRASYNQAQYLDERRAMMQQWSDVIDAGKRKVIPLKRRAAK